MYAILLQLRNGRSVYLGNGRGFGCDCGEWWVRIKRHRYRCHAVSECADFPTTHSSVLMAFPVKLTKRELVCVRVGRLAADADAVR